MKCHFSLICCKSNKVGAAPVYVIPWATCWRRIRKVYLFCHSPHSLGRDLGCDTLWSTRELLLLAIHLLVTFAKLLRPGSAGTIAAETLLVKQQLLVSNRSR